MLACVQKKLAVSANAWKESHSYDRVHEKDEPQEAKHIYHGRHGHNKSADNALYTEQTTEKEIVVLVAGAATEETRPFSPAVKELPGPPEALLSREQVELGSRDGPRQEQLL